MHLGPGVEITPTGIQNCINIAPVVTGTEKKKKNRMSDLEKNGILGGKKP